MLAIQTDRGEIRARKERMPIHNIKAWWLTNRRHGDNKSTGLFREYAISRRQRSKWIARQYPV